MCKAFSRSSGRIRFVALLSLALCGLLPLWLWASAPTWWAERGVLEPNAAPDDYAAVNQGQLKNIAKQAYEEMKERGVIDPVAAAASTNPDDPARRLFLAWQNPAAGTDDYRAINLGQLKNVAEPFYARLQELTYSGQPLAVGQTRPWSGTADDYALANIGQVKNLFSFDLGLLVINQDSDLDGLTDAEELALGTNPGLADTDGDGMPDGWELANRLNPLINDAGGDLDGDELSNIQEYTAGTSPCLVDTDGDRISDWSELNTNNTNPLDYYNGQTPVIVSVSGTGQSGPPGAFLLYPWVLRVTDASGHPLVNAPVTLTAAGATEGFSTASDDSRPVLSTLVVRTDSDGYARAFWKL